MKKLILLVCAFISCQCLAEIQILKRSLAWVEASLPEDTLLDFDSDRVKFQGCKFREYEIKVSQSLSEKVILDSTIGYSKGKLQWGVFSQQVSTHTWSVVPRLQLSEKLSIGVGVVAQSMVTFKTSQGMVFDLPKNTEWLAASRIEGLDETHYWELKISSQKWQATDTTGNWFERGLVDSKINLAYVGAF